MKKANNAPKHYCPYPFTQITTTPSGLWKLCCSAAEKNGFTSDFEGQLVYKISEVNLKEYWNGPYLEWVRQQHTHNKPIKECEACFKYEQNGAESYRQRALQERGYVPQKTKNPISLDLKLGNLCNASCLFCDPSSSSRVMEEWKAIGWDQKTPFSSGLTGPVDKSLFKTDYDWPNRSEFWNSLKEISSHLQNVKFTGGEPLINKYMMDYLEYLVENHYAKNIRLQITSNGIKIPSKFLSLTGHFKEIQLNFSVDGYGKQNEYIRYPTKWKHWLQNMINIQQQVHDSVELYFQHSYSAYSAFGLTDYFRWMWPLKRFRFHQFKVYHPEFQQTEILEKNEVEKIVENLTSLTKELRRKTSCQRDDDLLQEIKAISKFLENQEDKSHLKPKLKNFILTLDKYRKISIIDFIPRAANFLGITKKDYR